jgi:hypothetical protein
MDPSIVNSRIPLDELTRTERKLDPRFQLYHSRMLGLSLAFYCSEVLRGPTEYGGKFLLGPHHAEWDKAVSSENRILALAARDHGKSHFWCFGYPLWMADRVAPGRIGYIFSASLSQAQDHLAKIRAEIMGGGENGGPNMKLAHLLPFKKDNESTLKFANNSELRARGFDTRVRGGHPFWMVCDDIGNDEWIWSETVRGKSIDKFLTALRPMVVPGGQLIVVGTPFHAQDLYKNLEDNGVYHVMKHPAVDPATGEPLWPARYPAELLARTRQELGSALRFSREYLCQPISDESSLFPSYLFDAPGIKQPYRLGLGADHWKRAGMETYMGVDLAMSASAGADFFVCFVMAIDPATKDRYVVDIVRRKGLGYQAQVDVITQVCNTYECGLVFCEANQFQRVITDMVVRTSDVPIKAFYTVGKRKTTASRLGMNQTYSANKNALDQGVPALRMLLENGKIRIPWARETREEVQNWITEMQAFGWADGKLQGVGAHDDTVLAMWICDHACGVGGAFVSLGDGDDGPVREDLAFDIGSTHNAGDSVESTDDWRPDETIRVAW